RRFDAASTPEFRGDPYVTQKRAALCLVPGGLSTLVRAATSSDQGLEHPRAEKRNPERYSTRGVSLSSFHSIMESLKAEVKVTRGASLSRDSPPVPYHARENCGPDGIRTRTLKLDRPTCCQLHHGPWNELKSQAG